MVTGWLVGNADIDERWMLSAFLSARCGQPALSAPMPDPHQARLTPAPRPKDEGATPRLESVYGLRARLELH